MAVVNFPFGKEKIAYDFKEEELKGVLTSSIEEYDPKFSEDDLVLEALRNPVGSDSLAEMARYKKKVVIIASDHTRPVPSKVIMPKMLEEIRRYNKDAEITILIATGCHRGTTKDELVAKFGEEIVKNENIYIHDCDEKGMLQNIGTLPSGSECEINKIAIEADLLVAEGFIEPHFFAGFSGGRKSVLPGVAGRATVLGNHCAEFIADENSRTGILENNPIHKDMLWAAENAKLAFIVNVVLNAEKKVIFACAGHPEKAHKKGTDFLVQLCGAKAVYSDIVISTNGGYPLDQNIYQSVKGMTAAEATVKKGGVIIMLASADDGIGGDHFYNQMAEEENIEKIMEKVLKRGRSETLPDQWMTQILTRILLNSSVVYVSNAQKDIVEKMHMIPADSIDDAIIKAKEILGKEDVTITAIPDGVSVIVRK